ncbi:MAG: DUF2067 domain-containing protein [archaeon GB-1867-005]|nr:DUF2067 domain-containing protein [Candidatus Culexmicrobium cathedralense]
MRRGVERVFKISVSSEKELLAILDAICSRLTFVDLSISSKPGVVKVAVRGSHDDVRRAASLIRELTSIVKRKSKLKLVGINLFEVRALSREAGTAISLELLAEALQLRGFKCRVVDGGVETDADEDTVFEVARLIGSAYSNLQYETKSSSVKKLLALASSVSGLDLWTVVGAAEELKLLGRNESGRLVLRKAWREALTELLSSLKEVEELFR